MADQTTKNNSQQDIVDNLLVKEETGNLHYLKSNSNTAQDDNSANISQNSASDTDIPKEADEASGDVQNLINKQVHIK